MSDVARIIGACDIRPSNPLTCRTHMSHPHGQGTCRAYQDAEVALQAHDTAARWEWRAIEAERIATALDDAANRPDGRVHIALLDLAQILHDDAAQHRANHERATQQTKETA